MMATEPPNENLADVSTSPETRPPDQPCNVALDPPAVNGNLPVTNDEIANKRITSVEEQINSADVSVSGGSDTEASRPDWPRQKDGDKSHGRTTSTTRKPATFKAVSVNKTFLASKSTPSSTVPKANDKPNTGTSTPPPGSMTLSASRPRLVAKTGSGARDSTPRLSASVNGGKPAAAPDASAVWNKNRGMPLTPTSRSVVGADADFYEHDVAPEPKKLTDEELKKYGIHMASRLNEDDTTGQNKWADIDDDDDDWAPEAITWSDGTKTTLPIADEQVPATSENGDNASTSSKTKDQEKPKTPTSAATTSFPPPKVGGLPSGKGLVFKSASMEKPAVVTKQPVVTGPPKPAWAVLPPIDRVSPASAEAASTLRSVPKETPKPATSQPKEIAADDFSRSSWRDGMTHGSRELYNSQSGRYEPVTDRRGLARPDAQPKHPALLHRPQAVDQPAEPSSAFQTTRTSQDAPFARRRGSSNVSGGSGSYMARLGKGNGVSVQAPPELLATRRMSLAGSADGPPPMLSPANPPLSNQLPVSRLQPSHSWMARPLPGPTYGGPMPPEAKAGPAVPVERPVNDVQFQETLMRERREAARKRHEEEAAREEAAKRERIQKKLEALGPPPEKKSDKKEAVAKDEVIRPMQIKQRKPPEPSQPSSQPTGQTGSDSGLRETSGETAKTTPPKEEALAPRRLSQGPEGKRADPWAGSGPRPERFTNWTPGAPPSTRNVWGSPNNDRGLGNGTFNPDLGRVPGTAPQGQKGPSPIGPPASSRAPPQTQPSHAQVPSQGPPRYGVPAPDLASKWVAAVADGDKKIRAARLAERIGRERQLAEQGMSMEDLQPTIKDTWRPVQIPGDGTRRVVGAPEVQSQPPGPWKASQDTGNSGPASDAAPPAHVGLIGPGTGSVLPPTGSGAPPQPRGSRFFPSRDIRHDMGFPAAESFRPASPSLPPPTMEGHPAYEGDAVHPHVSLPKPQPVVKLPPSLMASNQSQQPRPNVTWASRLGIKESLRAPPSLGRVERAQGSWQDKFNNLLYSDKSRHAVLDPASRSIQEPFTRNDSVTTAARFDMDARSPRSKPMAEECFGEQEMGSLPQIRLPHKVPDAAWQPAVAPAKLLPRRFVVQASMREPYCFVADVTDGGSTARIQILLPGMAGAKFTTIALPTPRGGRGGGHARSSPRHKNLGHGPRGGGGGGGKREPSSPFGGKEPGSTRGGRGMYRSRRSDSWSRPQVPVQPKALASSST
ncbi:hypothetical protein L249_4948 [Ophiocordyceps polyrhachis-furcata BCC 54312]|uniref:Uncharacterized protein n=1 Tax=Ophiocordyceps polyrhachis-furcata BCC 54312 TaxID=1330021 RepID=A0A367L3M0_9HYPO|nr:hypothetical protein L249_4948 [Ophiocordyceps polyrhachis-furcata BCC 54312]